MTQCTYCENNLKHYEPVHVTKNKNTMSFCNYACLTAYIDENNLTEDECCKIELE